MLKIELYYMKNKGVNWETWDKPDQTEPNQAEPGYGLLGRHIVDLRVIGLVECHACELLGLLS